jgi:chromosome segregation ATPase
MLATLRTRLERTREEQQRQDQQLAEQRTRHEALETELQARQQQLQRMQEELDNEKQVRDQERRQWEERSATMEAAVTQLRHLHERLAEEDVRLKDQTSKQEEVAAQQAEQSALLRARSDEILELQQRMTADRQALRDRESALLQAEQAVAALQEQLRRRGEELTARQRAQADEARKYADETATLEARRADMESAHKQAEESVATRHQELEQRTAELEKRTEELAQREQMLQQHVERLKEAGRAIGKERKERTAEREQERARQREETESLARARAELESARQSVQELHQQLPELEGQAQTAADRLAEARAQLREHLAEVHSYARQSQGDFEELRTQVLAESEQLRHQEAALLRARNEHNLAVAAFRQQLIDWQAQVTDMKRSLSQGETRLERREAEMAEQARRAEETSARLAKQAEQLQEQERQVAEQRGEMERHLADMREWYRKKLRELAGGTGERGQGAGAGKEDAGGLHADSAPPPGEAASPGSPVPGSLIGARDILTLTGEIEPGDKALGELLQSLELVDAATLKTLLTEARKQRRSLRQALLASGCLTLYQMAVIEAGNLDKLVLGPVRVVDRLRATARETAYRVFDPRRGGEALLRHLAEEEMEDAVHPDEFRQRFSQAAAVQHPHVAATYETLEIHDRPAVLQEWLNGMPSSEWPPLASMPGVWFRLVSQAALGLQTAHQAGLVHGHLEPGLIVLSADGVLKLCGFGEPPWLTATPATPWQDEPALDLTALGKIATEWAGPVAARKGSKNKSLPEPLLGVLQRLRGEQPETRHASAGALLEDLERVGADLPANAAAWQRLLSQVRNEGAQDPEVRESA